MKSIGYIIAIVGLAGLLITFEAVQTITKITLPEQISKNTLMIVSVVLILIGLFFLMKGKGGKTKTGAEVPVYEGNKIVAYRRV